MPGWLIELISARIDDGDTVVTALTRRPRAVVDGPPARARGPTSRPTGAAALMAPPAEGQEPWAPVPCSSTAIVVADAAGAEAPQRYRLQGNFEPEAFSRTAVICS